MHHAINMRYKAHAFVVKMANLSGCLEQQKQVVKVIWHKAATLSHMGGSIVFASWSQCHPNLTLASLAPHKSTSQRVSPSIQLFSHSSWQRVPVLYNGHPFSPRKLPLRMWDLDPYLNDLIHGSLGPPKCTTQMASQWVQPFFAGLSIVTDQ